MTNGGDAAEQVVRLSLEGFEVAAKLSGAAAKNIAVLLVSVLKQEQKTKGKARLTNMIKSGKELKVFSIPNKDLKKFTEQAKRYGVLYCVLRDKTQRAIMYRLILLPVQRTLPKFSESLRDLNSARLIRLRLSPSLRRLSKSVKLWKKTSRRKPKTKSSLRKPSENLFKKRGIPSQTPQSPKRTKTLRQGTTPSR